MNGNPLSKTVLKILAACLDLSGFEQDALSGWREGSEQ